MSNRVVHFEIHTADPDRAAKFYGDVFGWKIEEWKMQGVEMADENRYWMINTGEEGTPGINGGIVIRRGPAPAEQQAVNAFVCTVDVASIDESVKKAEEAGGVITVPKMAIPTVGWLVYCKDLDGNLFGMMQEDKEAGA
jgi:uncharacterized protein